MKNINTLRKILVISTCALVLSNCSDDFTAPDSPEGTPISAVVAASDNFNILNASLNKTGQVSSLNNNNSGFTTVFAPDDAAFYTYFKAAVAGNTFATEADVLVFVNGMTTTTVPSIATLNSVLTYHMVSSKITSDLITGNQVFATLNGARLSISKGSTVVLNANVAVNGATITAVDAVASNGVIHTIDRVMTAVSSATVLTPFGVTVSYTTNPPTIGGGSETGGNAVGTDYNILAYALRVSGLVPTILPNATPLPDYTIFAPTDDAFRAYLGDATPVSIVKENAAIQALKALTTAALADILKYHVVSGRKLTSDFTAGQLLTTLLTSKTITVTINGATYTLADANTGVTDPTITSANILTNSGIVHRINGVLRSN